MAKYQSIGPKIAANREPYHVPSNENSSGGFFQKLRGFFRSKSVEKSPIKVKSSTLSEIHSNDIQQQDFDLSTVSVASKNPNDTLADFFSSRGEKPLNDIEIEGVMSLIRKAHNSNIESRNASMMNHSRSGIFAVNTSRIASGVSRNQSLLYNDSNNSTILRHGSSKVNIPTPRFNPPKSANTSMTQVDKSMLGSIIKKRKMVNYNNLEQQKQKISSPLASYIEKRKRENRMREKQRNNLTKLEEEVIPETGIRQNLSKTANTVLDILDSKAVVSSSVKLPVNDFKTVDDKKKDHATGDDVIVIDEPVKKYTFTGFPKAKEVEVPEKKEETVVEDGDEIIIIEDEKDEEQEAALEEKSIIEPIKPLNSQTPKDPLISISKLPAAPKFTFESNKVELEEPSKSVETPIFPFKPMADLVPDSSKAKASVETQKFPEQPKFSFTPARPLFTKIVEEPSSTKFSFNTEIKPVSSVINDAEKMIDGQKDDEDDDEDEEQGKEIIEHFDFPDVSDTNIEITKIHGEYNEHSKAWGKIYEFPSAPPPNKELVEKIDDNVVQLYNDSFKF